MAPIFMGPSLWDDTVESKTATLEQMFQVAVARNTSKQDAAKDVQRWAQTDVRFHEPIKRGINVGEAVMKAVEGDRTALSFLKK